MFVNSPGIILPFLSIPLEITFGSCCSLGSVKTSIIIGLLSLKIALNEESISSLVCIATYLNPKTFAISLKEGIETPDENSDAT